LTARRRHSIFLHFENRRSADSESQQPAQNDVTFPARRFRFKDFFSDVMSTVRAFEEFFLLTSRQPIRAFEEIFSWTS
jgi:hypothetical protein